MGIETVTSWPVFVLYVTALIVAIAILHHQGTGWAVAVPIALAIAALLSVLLALVISKGRRH